MDAKVWLEPVAIAYRLKADGKRAALAALSEMAGRLFCVPAGEVLDRLLAREAQGSTGIGRGVAVPHAHLPGLSGMRAVFVRLDAPVEFSSLDDQPVDLLFALFAPEGAGSEHLRTLARVSRLLRRGDVREQLRQARSADALHALLVQETSASAA